MEPCLPLGNKCCEQEKYDSICVHREDHCCGQQRSKNPELFCAGFCLFLNITIHSRKVSFSGVSGCLLLFVRPDLIRETHKGLNELLLMGHSSHNRSTVSSREGRKNKTHLAWDLLTKEVNFCTLNYEHIPSIVNLTS